MIKAWKKHLKMTQHFAVPLGGIRLVVYDNRQSSASYGKVEIMEIGENNYCLVRIPPLLWYGFKGISTSPALTANCTNIAHDPDEVERLDPYSDQIPYDWGKN